MAEYDLDGWKVPDLTDPGEPSHHVMRGPVSRALRHNTTANVIE